MGIIYRPRPFSWALNTATLTIANRLMPQGWDTAPDGCWPETYEGSIAYYEATGRICVRDEGTANDNIYGDAEAHEAFRAWHDYHHIVNRRPFTMRGETEAVADQMRDLEKMQVGGPEGVAVAKDLIQGEIIGALNYKLEHSDNWAPDHREFMRQYLVEVLGRSVAEDGRPWPIPGEVWPPYAPGDEPHTATKMERFQDWLGA